MAGKSTDQRVNEAILRVFSAYKAALGRGIAERELEISSMHFRCLQVIRRTSPCTARLVSERIRRDKSQVARLLGDLTRLDYVASEADPEDRRNRLLRLTPRGEAVASEVEGIERTVVEGMTRGIGRRELEQFVGISEQMLENMAGPHD